MKRAHVSRWVSVCIAYHWKPVVLWGLIIAGMLSCILVGRADAWVIGNQHFPDGKATIVVHRFCRSTFDAGCDAHPSQDTWQRLIREVVTEWNEAGANWTFHTRPARRSDNPCTMTDAIPVILATTDNLCSGDRFPLSSTAGMVRGWPGRARVYVNANSLASLGSRGVRRILLHEFGHIVGLGHPDEAGQQVVALMNGTHSLDTLQPDDIAGIQALYGRSDTVVDEPDEPDDTLPPSGPGFLGNPRDGSTQSGIGLISGWVCEAENIEIVVEDSLGRVLAEVAVVYGMERLDVAAAGICETETAGFATIFNWSSLGDGTRLVRIFIDGQEAHRASVTVVTFGQSFLRGASGRYRLTDFPSRGQSVVVEWEQGLQNFVITETDATRARAASSAGDLAPFNFLIDNGAGDWEIDIETTTGEPGLYFEDVSFLGYRTAESGRDILVGHYGVNPGPQTIDFKLGHPVDVIPRLPSFHTDRYALVLPHPSHPEDLCTTFLFNTVEKDRYGDINMPATGIISVRKSGVCVPENGMESLIDPIPVNLGITLD